MVCFLISISLALALPTVRNSLMTDQLASGSRKIISLIKSARSKAVMTRQPYLIFLDPAEQRLWYQEAGGDREEPSAAVHPSITLPAGVHILDIKQANSGNDQNALSNGLWISKQGYMDKTAIHLGDGSDKSISLLISPFLHTIQVLDGPVHFE
ncbi:MAG: hypothetical protein KKE53_17750 [Proteobacteria bacterium]|nr:hypothetical protein [Pseudomonadota bacterium]